MFWLSAILFFFVVYNRTLVGKYLQEKYEKYLHEKIAYVLHCPLCFGLWSSIILVLFGIISYEFIFGFALASLVFDLIISKLEK